MRQKIASVGRNASAAIHIAPMLPIAAIARPPSVGPTTRATPSAPKKIAFASVSSCSSTSEGTNAEVRGHGPHDLDRAEEESDHVDELHREESERGRERDHERERDARGVAGDQQQSLVGAVDERSGGCAEEDVGHALNDAERRG